MKTVEFNWKKVKKHFNRDDRVLVSYGGHDYIIMAQGHQLELSDLQYVDCIIIVADNTEEQRLCPQILVRPSIDSAIQYILDNEA